MSSRSSTRSSSRTRGGGGGVSGSEEREKASKNQKGFEEEEYDGGDARRGRGRASRVCDMCWLSDGAFGFRLLECRACGLLVHDECYGYKLPAPPATTTTTTTPTTAAAAAAAASNASPNKKKKPPPQDAQQDQPPPPPPRPSASMCQNLITCWACAAVGTRIRFRTNNNNRNHSNNNSNSNSNNNSSKKRKRHSTDNNNNDNNDDDSEDTSSSFFVESRPTECCLCSVDDGMEIPHAMHPLFDDHGNRGRQIRLPAAKNTVLRQSLLHQHRNNSNDGDTNESKNNKDDRDDPSFTLQLTAPERPAWVHTLCAMALCGTGYVYGCRKDGSYQGEDEDEDTARLYTDKHAPVNPMLKINGKEPYAVWSTINHFVWINQRWYGTQYPTVKKRNALQKQCHCNICHSKDLNTYRVPVQCQAFDKDEWKPAKSTHAHHSSKTCCQSFHVGCAFYGYDVTAGTYPAVRRVYFFPGSYETPKTGVDPYTAYYCTHHANDLQKANVPGSQHLYYHRHCHTTTTSITRSNSTTTSTTTQAIQNQLSTEIKPKTDAKEEEEGTTPTRSTHTRKREKQSKNDEEQEETTPTPSARTRKRENQPKEKVASKPKEEEAEQSMRRSMGTIRTTSMRTTSRSQNAVAAETVRPHRQRRHSTGSNAPTMARIKKPKRRASAEASDSEADNNKTKRPVTRKKIRHEILVADQVLDHVDDKDTEQQQEQQQHDQPKQSTLLSSSLPKHEEKEEQSEEQIMNSPPPQEELVDYWEGLDSTQTEMAEQMKQTLSDAIGRLENSHLAVECSLAVRTELRKTHSSLSNEAFRTLWIPAKKAVEHMYQVQLTPQRKSTSQTWMTMMPPIETDLLLLDSQKPSTNPGQQQQHSDVAELATPPTNELSAQNTALAPAITESVLKDAASYKKYPLFAKATIATSFGESNPNDNNDPSSCDV